MADIKELRKLAKDLRDNPESWEQQAWTKPKGEWTCGTAGCMAGNYVLAKGWRPYSDETVYRDVIRVGKPEREEEPVRDLAVEGLGLTEYQANALFSANNTLPLINRLIDLIEILETSQDVEKVEDAEEEIDVIVRAEGNGLAKRMGWREDQDLWPLHQPRRYSFTDRGLVDNHENWDRPPFGLYEYKDVIEARAWAENRRRDWEKKVGKIFEFRNSHTDAETKEAFPDKQTPGLLKLFNLGYSGLQALSRFGVKEIPEKAKPEDFPMFMEGGE